MKLSQMDSRERNIDAAPARRWLGLSSVLGVICLLLFLHYLPDLADDGRINRSPEREEKLALHLDQQAIQLKQAIQEKERRLPPEQRAARQRRRERQRRIASKMAAERQAFNYIARRSAAPEFRLVEGAMGGFYGDHLAIVVADDWRAQPPEARRRMARLYWRTWAGIHSPDNPNRSTISLWDWERRCLAASRGPGSRIVMWE